MPELMVQSYSRYARYGMRKYWQYLLIGCLSCRLTASRNGIVVQDSLRLKAMRASLPSILLSLCHGAVLSGFLWVPWKVMKEVAMEDEVVEVAEAQGQ